MRVFNLTDVETPVLVSRGLVNTSVQVGGVVIQPGEAEDVPNPAGAQALLTVGAISFDAPPGEYLKRKAEVRSRKPTEAPPPSSPPEPPEDLTRAGAREESVEEEEKSQEEEEPAESKSGKKTRKKRGGRNR